MHLNVIIAVDTPETMKLLQEGLAGCEEVTVIKMKPDRLFKIENLDAFYTSVMGAEHWGARPIPHKAQVIPVGSADVEKGYPPYVIAGGLFELEDPAEPQFQLQVIVNSVLSAVDSFNAQNGGAIKKVGFWADDLCLPVMSPLEVGQMINSAYQEHYHTP